MHDERFSPCLHTYLRTNNIYQRACSCVSEFVSSGSCVIGVERLSRCAFDRRVGVVPGVDRNEVERSSSCVFFCSGDRLSNAIKDDLSPLPRHIAVICNLCGTSSCSCPSSSAGGNGDKVIRVRTGDDVSGWKVERVEPRRLVLTQGERSVDFGLFDGAAKAAKAAKPPERRIPRPKVSAPGG